VSLLIDVSFWVIVDAGIFIWIPFTASILSGKPFKL